MLAALYIVYILVVAFLKPDKAPPIPAHERAALSRRELWVRLVKGVAPVGSSPRRASQYSRAEVEPGLSSFWSFGISFSFSVGSRYSVTTVALDKSALKISIT